MNQAKFEKIDGREALKRLADGETILDGSNRRYLLNWMNLVVRRESGAYETVNDGLKQILEKTWYVPKPFDVRQAMRDRPNEWVGAFEAKGDWYKVGFDESGFVALYCNHGLHRELRYTERNVYMVTKAQLDACIPIEDVPKEATR